MSSQIPAARSGASVSWCQSIYVLPDFPSYDGPGKARPLTLFLRNASGWDLRIYDAHPRADVSYGFHPGACRDNMSHFSHAGCSWDVSFFSFVSSVFSETSILPDPCFTPFRREDYTVPLSCVWYIWILVAPVIYVSDSDTLIPLLQPSPSLKFPSNPVPSRHQSNSPSLQCALYWHSLQRTMFRCFVIILYSSESSKSLILLY